MPPRNIVLDARTVRAMVHIYYRGQHLSPRGRLCADCEQLAAYADLRLAQARPFDLNHFTRCVVDPPSGRARTHSGRT